MKKNLIEILEKMKIPYIFRCNEISFSYLQRGVKKLIIIDFNTLNTFCYKYRKNGLNKWEQFDSTCYQSKQTEIILNNCFDNVKQKESFKLGF